MKIAVAIPCFRCSDTIIGILQRIPAIVTQVYVVDDGCPDQTGKIVQEKSSDPRVSIIFHEQNRGVGAAMISAYREALRDNMDIVVKIDGDGQMDPADIMFHIKPLLNKRADYTKGNRFFRLNLLKGMPLVRIMGNSVLSFFSKLSSGYWNLMDPSNGFTAIHRDALSLIKLDKIDNRFFFETDMLFQLGLNRAVVWDIPMASKYENERSNLLIHHVMFSFLYKHTDRFLKRIFYMYVLRDFNLGSIEALGGTIFLTFGCLFGGYHWVKSFRTGFFASTGTVMLAGITVILGIQFLLSALMYDTTRIPKTPLQSLKD